MQSLAAFTVMTVLAFAPTARGATDTLTFKDHGKTIKTLSGAQAAQLAPPASIKTYETHEAAEGHYKAMPMRKLLTAVYGDKWKSADEVLVTCSDGYQPSIPVQKFAAYEAYLATAREDQAQFTLVNKLQNNEVVNLGPYYLVWDNLKAPELKEEGASDQPYQVVGFDLIEFEQKFPRMAPPPKSGAQVSRGFVAFRKHCMACHTINGEGGQKAVELNYPTSVTEYIHESYLKKWIDKPTSIRFNATMPPLNPSAKNRGAILEDVVTYLKSMAKKKVEPAKG